VGKQINVITVTDLKTVIYSREFCNIWTSFSPRSCVFWL